jgi:hypothetical protein
MVLLLVPAMGGMLSTLSAQQNAGDTTADLALITYADSELDRVCAGESVAFSVIAIRPSTGDRVNEVLVIATVPDSTIGKFKQSYGRTWALYTPPGSVPFTFAGLRPGTTELSFYGVGLSVGPGNQTKTLKRPVRVISCDSMIKPPVATGNSGGGPGAPGGSGILKNRKGPVTSARISKVKLTTRSAWSVGMEIRATIEDGVMIPDNEGHFTGSASVTWWTSIIGTAGCGAAEYTIPPSGAALAGEMDEDNQLVVTITFEPRDFSGFATCGPSLSTGNVAMLDPLTIRVPATGGSSTQPHSVTAKNGAFVGSVTVVVATER